MQKALVKIKISEQYSRFFSINPAYEILRKQRWWWIRWLTNSALLIILSKNQGFLNARVDILPEIGLPRRSIPLEFANQCSYIMIYIGISCFEILILFLTYFHIIKLAFCPDTTHLCLTNIYQSTYHLNVSSVILNLVIS